MKKFKKVKRMDYVYLKKAARKHLHESKERELTEKIHRKRKKRNVDTNGGIKHALGELAYEVGVCNVSYFQINKVLQTREK